jgi:hypothetical protein
VGCQPPKIMGSSGRFKLIFFAILIAEPIIGPERIEMPRQSASAVSRRITFSKSGEVKLSTSLTSNPASSRGDASASKHSGAPSEGSVIGRIK